MTACRLQPPEVFSCSLRALTATHEDHRATVWYNCETAVIHKHYTHRNSSHVQTLVPLPRLCTLPCIKLLQLPPAGTDQQYTGILHATRPIGADTMQARLIGKDNTWQILMQHVHDCITSTKEK